MLTATRSKGGDTMADLIASVREDHAQVVGVDDSAPRPRRASPIDSADRALVRRDSGVTLAIPPSNAPRPIRRSGWCGGLRGLATALVGRAA
jgi:hypothetical protein